MPSHTHSYIRYRTTKSGRIEYKCADPICPHIAERNFLVGKLSLCPACASEFILTRDSLRRARPLCMNCSNSKESQQYRKTKSVVDNLLESLKPKTFD